LQAIDKCSLTKALVTVKQPILTNYVTVTYQLNLNGEKTGNCLFKMVTQNAVVEANTEAFKYVAQEYLKQGIITQQKYDESINQPQDTTKDQNSWNKHKGDTYDCSIPSSVLKPILTKSLIAKPWSPSDLNLYITIGTNEGLGKYCKVSTNS
jgi:hypothetical protein